MEDKQINELEKLELEKNKLLLSAENVIGRKNKSGGFPYEPRR